MIQIGDTVKAYGPGMCAGQVTGNAASERTGVVRSGADGKTFICVKGSDFEAVFHRKQCRRLVTKGKKA